MRLVRRDAPADAAPVFYMPQMGCAVQERALVHAPAAIRGACPGCCAGLKGRAPHEQHEPTECHVRVRE